MNAPRHLGNRVRVLSQAIRQAIDRKLTDLDLTGQQSFILRYLSERKDEVVYPKDIEKRFLTCEPDPDDRRYKRVLLTEKAEDCQKQIWEHIQSIEARMTAGMQESEVDMLVRLLDTAAQNLDVSMNFDCMKEEKRP